MRSSTGDPLAVVPFKATETGAHGSLSVHWKLQLVTKNKAGGGALGETMALGGGANVIIAYQRLAAVHKTRKTKQGQLTKVLQRTV